MVVYEKTPDHHNGTLSHKVKERYIYGSNRVGTYTEEKEMIGASTINTTFSHPLGARHYELTNHLGNVLAVVSDAPIKADTNNDHLRDYHLPTLLSTQDYYPFGSLMRERSFGRYRYGFNGMEKDDEVKGSGNSYTTEFRQYDPRLGRWLSVDPLAYKLSSWSSYNFSFNNPLYYIDELGNIPYPVALKWIRNKKFVWGKQAGMSTSNQEYGKRTTGKFHYGIDFNIGAGSDDLGIELLNLADGEVLESGSTPRGGNYIIIRHGNGYITRFFHMQEKPELKQGQSVDEGDVIGKIGGSFGYPVHGHLEMAKLPDSDVSNEMALKQFKSNKYHFDPRDVIGDGILGDGKGDLQELSTESDWSLSSWWSSWSFSDLLFGPSSKEANSTSITVNTSGGNLNLRKGAGSDFDVIKSIANGSTLTGTGKVVQNWIEVTTSDNQTGWVSSDYIKND